MARVRSSWAWARQFFFPHTHFVRLHGLLKREEPVGYQKSSLFTPMNPHVLCCFLQSVQITSLRLMKQTTSEPHQNQTAVVFSFIILPNISQDFKLLLKYKTGNVNFSSFICWAAYTQTSPSSVSGSAGYRFRVPLGHMWERCQSVGRPVGPFVCLVSCVSEGWHVLQKSFLQQMCSLLKNPGEEMEGWSGRAERKRGRSGRVGRRGRTWSRGYVIFWYSHCGILAYEFPF